MNKILVLIFVALACSGAARAQLVSATLGIDGLTCSMCAKGTEASLRSLDFIDDVKMDLNALTATIRFKKNANVSLDKLAKAIADAGFSMREASVSFEFQNLKVDKDFHYEWNGAQYHFVNASSMTLAGATVLKIVDKEFIVADEYEKWKKEIQHECYEIGYMKSCCSVEKTSVDKSAMKKTDKPVRVYHVAMEKK
jgi:copper chaperone CopZ